MGINETESVPLIEHGSVLHSPDYLFQTETAVLCAVRCACGGLLLDWNVFLSELIVVKTGVTILMGTYGTCLCTYL
jgi:hypothetical protein